MAVQQDGSALKFAAAALQAEKEVASRLQKPTESGGKEISPFCRALGQNCKVKENCLFVCLTITRSILNDVNDLNKGIKRPKRRLTQGCLGHVSSSVSEC